PVEESLQYVTRILNMTRTAAVDVELHGETIRAGDKVLLMYSSANRDETVFEDPERFDITRDPNPHVAFGFGTHFCLGASLARMEIRVMYEELLRRLPDIHVVPGHVVRWTPGAFVRGIDTLAVRAHGPVGGAGRDRVHAAGVVRLDGLTRYARPAPDRGREPPR